jgi:hypothetical protein
MSSSAKRLTIESMSVLTNESHAEAFAEVRLKHWIGSDIMLEFTTLGRTKQVESARALVGEPPAWIEINVLSALDLLDNVPEFHNHATRSGIDANATLKLWTSNLEALDAFGNARQSADEAAVSEPEAEPAEPESSDEEAPAAAAPVEKPANATVPRPKPAAPVVAAPSVPPGTSPRLRRSSPFTGRTMMTPKAASSFVEAITDAGLDGLLDALQRAGITSLISLKKHDIAELEASLRRPHVKLGSTYSLSRVDVQSFIELGVKPSRTTPNADGGAGALPDVFSMAAHTLGAAASAAPLTLSVPTAALATAGKPVLTSAPHPTPAAATPRAPAAAGPPRPGTAAPTTAPIPASAVAISEAFNASPRARALLEKVPTTELSLPALWLIAQAIHGETALSFKNMDESEESVVDAIDASIAALCAAETMTREESLGLSSTPCSSMREVRKKVAEWAARSRVVKLVADLPAEVEGLGGAMTMQSGLAMLAASSQSFSGDNLKHVEEHGAAEARAVAVHGDAQAKRRLLDLGAKMTSGMANADKIAAHALACETDAKVAALLASSHIKRITGALALTPGLAEVATVAGQVRAAVVRAAKEELRALELVRPYAEPEALVKAVQAMRLYDKGSNALSLKPLAGTDKELEYLAVPAISPKPPAAAAELAITRNLFAALPLLETVFAMAAPWDTTAVKTLATVHTVMSHGLAKHGASTAVLNVLLPLLREYEERVDSFQRSPSAPIPDLASCWAHTKTLAITATFITEARKQLSNLELAPDAQALKAQNDAQSKELKKLEERMKKLEAKPGAPYKPPTKPDDAEATKGAAKKEALRLGRELLAKQAAAAGVQPAQPAKKLTHAKGAQDGDLATQL